MGTTYSLSFINSEDIKIDKHKLKNKIDKRLKQLNDMFSTYINDSTISKFNTYKSKKKFLIKKEFAFVVKNALHLYDITEGAFNIAIDPLIDLWGFDKSGRITKKPTHNRVLKALKQNDLNLLMVEDNTIRKQNKEIKINLSGIAKGYAVDAIGNLLKNQKIDNFLFEIGGEIVSKGQKPKGKYFKVGINNPQTKGQHNNLIAIISLHNKALASSGTYLNFFEHEGKTYSHIIDPNTGYPIKTNLISVSIIAPNCMLADALATSAMIMGEKKTRQIIKQLKEVGAMFVTKDNDSLKLSFTSKFKQVLD